MYILSTYSATSLSGVSKWGTYGNGAIWSLFAYFYTNGPLGMGTLRLDIFSNVFPPLGSDSVANLNLYIIFLCYT